MPPSATADEAAEAPEAVRGRHDRAAELLLDRDRVGVHGDVRRADRAAEDIHGDRRGPDIGGEGNEQKAEAAGYGEASAVTVFEPWCEMR